MPKVEFPGGSTAEIKVAGKSVTDAPPITLPVGPRTFSPPPPPPPPPPIALPTAAPHPTDATKLRLTWPVGVVVVAVPFGLDTASSRVCATEQTSDNVIDIQLTAPVASSGSVMFSGTSPLIRTPDGAFVSAGTVVWP